MLYTGMSTKKLQNPAVMEEVKYQKTLSRTIQFTGVGVHSNQQMTMEIHPAAADTGYVFRRTDLKENNIVIAAWDKVSDTRMCTRITNDSGVSIATIEHIIAALAGCGIDNAIIDINGPEVPIMDGSSKEYVEEILRHGMTELEAPRTFIKVLKPVEVRQGNNYARLLPDNGYNMDISFDFSGRLGDKKWQMSYSPLKDDFADLAFARTFGFYEDAEKLWAAGMSLGASLDNTVVLDKDGTAMNKQGLRAEDELIRHKTLDAIGDLALAGGVLLGKLESHNPGHNLNNLVLRELFKSQDNWCYETLVPAKARAVV